MKTLMCLVVMLVVSSVAWGQNSCLVVRSKHHMTHTKYQRVFATQDVQFKTKYSNRDLNKMDAQGTRIVVIDKHDAIPLEACEYVAPTAAPVSAPRTHATMRFDSKPVCVETLTHRNGDTHCLRWNTERE